MNDFCFGLQHKIDIFGETVRFKFQGRDKYSTPVGAVISCLTLTGFLIFFLVRTAQLFSSENPNLTMISMAADGQSIDLYDLNFFFAIENIDPRAGRISATYTKWTRGEKKQK